MSPNEFPSDEKLSSAVDSAMEAIRNEVIDVTIVEAATGRVWTQLSDELRNKGATAMRSCADFQALIPDYQAERLSEPRRLLVKDHLHECIACRKIYMGRTPAADRATRSGAKVGWPLRSAIAAAIALTIGLSGWYLFQQFGVTTALPTATVTAVKGSLFRVADEKLIALEPGAGIQAGEQIKVAKDTNATIQLRDGSSIETRERSDFAITETVSYTHLTLPTILRV